MTISILATVLRAMWFIGEIAHASHRKVTPAKDWDRSSLKILKLATLAVPVGVIVGFTDVGHIHTEGNFLGAVGFALMLVGISIRWVAIHTLGGTSPAPSTQWMTTALFATACTGICVTLLMRDSCLGTLV